MRFSQFWTDNYIIILFISNWKIMLNRQTAIFTQFKIWQLSIRVQFFATWLWNPKKAN